jgi:phosphoribosylamine--glycine ligase
LAALCDAAIDGKLNSVQAQWDSRVSLGVVMAAGGYPFDYRKGDVIRGLPSKETEDVKVFHAGTQESDGQVVTAGGRVLCVVALGDSVSQAQSKAYQTVRNIQWQDAYYRTDIGYRAIAREQSM